MKISVLSDIHTDLNDKENDKIIDSLRLISEETDTGVFLIAGDVSNNYESTVNFMNELTKNSHSSFYFVPGNHDMWNIENKIDDSWKIYNEYKKYDWCISGKKINLNSDWCLVGDIGWYDYSFSEKNFFYSEFNSGKNFDRQWKDKLYVNWNKTDSEMTDYFFKSFEELVKGENKNIIFMTHMLTNNFFTVHDNEMWKFFNAFLGSEKYSKLINKYNNIKFSVMGHVHYRKIFSQNNCVYICNCLNYRSEWENPENSSYNEIKNAVYTFEI